MGVAEADDLHLAGERLGSHTGGQRVLKERKKRMDSEIAAYLLEPQSEDDGY